MTFLTLRIKQSPFSTFFYHFLPFFTISSLFSPQPEADSKPKPKKQPKKTISKRGKSIYFVKQSRYKTTKTSKQVRKKLPAQISLCFFRLFSVTRNESMTQVIKRRSTSQTKAGQYMCPECGQIFDSKKEVDSHLNMMHESF